MKLRRVDGIVLCAVLLTVTIFNLMVILGVVPMAFANTANILVIICTLAVNIRTMVLRAHPEKARSASSGQSGLIGKALFIALISLSAAWIASVVVLAVMLMQSH